MSHTTKNISLKPVHRVFSILLAQLNIYGVQLTILSESSLAMSLIQSSEIQLCRTFCNNISPSDLCKVFSKTPTTHKNTKFPPYSVSIFAFRHCGNLRCIYFPPPQGKISNNIILSETCTTSAENVG